MPVLLNNIEQDLQNAAQQALVKVYTPKFFDSRLTGSGGAKPGLLSNRNNPISVPAARNTETNHYDVRKKGVIQNGATSIYRYPVNPLTLEAWQSMEKFKYPAIVDLTKVGEYTDYHGKKFADLYIKLDVTAFTLEETLTVNNYTGTSTKSIVFIPSYQLMFYVINDINNNTADRCSSAGRLDHNRNCYAYEFTSNPIKDWNDDFQKVLVNAGFTVDQKAIMDYFTNYEVYDGTCERSEEWQTKMPEIMRELLDNLSKKAQSCNSWDRDDAQRTAEKQMRYIMSHNIPLECYKDIYTAIAKVFAPDAANRICKQNLNLLLSDTLEHLDANKSQLVTFQTPNPAVPLPPTVQKLSKEQTAAVKSNEPLILVQAGAGTGKSTLILGRIDYLIACGIQPSDITVLSFTNAAADHITEKNPNINSMTIARMIHEIYTTNFKNHELSQIDTIMNSLEIYYKADMTNSKSVAYRFGQRLHALIKNDTNSFTDMNNFIEENYDEVMKILDTIRQTSLELEIIICYQKIDTLVEPTTVQSKFLIIDEVQDNSIFEFVYALKYIDKHKESMFIVGDCSQTLYEFRASNPRALNILEGSGTFATYQLTTNYRSNQEILDMANVLLQNIEANQYANIQLHANSLAQVTEQSFLEKVHFDYERLNKISDFKDAFPGLFARNIKGYVQKCLNKGEQVAFLAFTRRDIELVKSILIHQFPNINPDTDIVSLVPTKMYNQTIMSKFICKYWDTVKFMPTTNIMYAIKNEIMQKLQYIIYNATKAAPAISGMLMQWISQEGPTVNAWVNQVNNGQITHDEFLDYLKDNMLQFEIQTNAVKQALLSAKNQDAKQSQNVSNAKFLLSTIHSAKGLEFDNVVVLYQNKAQMEEDKKRMYYVAFTRAMKSEFIFAYDTVVSPQIQVDYNTVLKALHAVAPAQNSPFNAQPKAKRIKI